MPEEKSHPCGPPHRDRTRLDRQRVYRCAVAFVEREHARQLTLGEVARHALTSTRLMQRVLTDEGTSFRGLLLQVRMAQAARLLATQASPVGEVARAVGYPEPAAFSKAFRRHFGCSPTAWREARRGGR